MARKKKANAEELLSRPIALRLTQLEYDRLEKLRLQSDCHSIGEVIRRILGNRQVKLFHQDSSMDSVMEELAGIRAEIRAIGININQVTRHFNGSTQVSKRDLLAHQALQQYRKVETKVSLLLSLISQLARKW
ncbi:plasmid mobilization relaxosome protein MobC [Pontibacter qinzhouensis]|uniref:Plasmid mobilization relaxosome protein MobC n=1 Tax=Pontibacter qinzhouensis TaxID=2603253 RepID=A0A5C8JJR6_9BACT|nr:plasmid mobilization relaxosome protein MobC [Pontibacter qinzhouensis]TXK37692.1 plasmid mobilization relaxosome protein MobC [Pontibacter qinzhouensis]